LLPDLIGPRQHLHGDVIDLAVPRPGMRDPGPRREAAEAVDRYVDVRPRHRPPEKEQHEEIEERGETPRQLLPEIAGDGHRDRVPHTHERPGEIDHARGMIAGQAAGVRPAPSI